MEHCTYGCWRDYRPGKVRVNEHEGVVGALVATGGICVHHIQLSPQVVPVL